MQSKGKGKGKGKGRRGSKEVEPVDVGLSEGALDGFSYWGIEDAPAPVKRRFSVVMRERWHVDFATGTEKTQSDRGRTVEKVHSFKRDSLSKSHIQIRFPAPYRFSTILWTSKQSN